MIALIAAYSKNRVIGKNGKIPWKIPGEQKRFKELTTGNVVIMGRRTYDGIGHPLPDRYTIVISNTANYTSKNCTTVTSFYNALKLASDLGCQLTKTENVIPKIDINPQIHGLYTGNDCFVAGGERIYREAIKIVHKMYITEVDIDIDGDTFFPHFDESGFIKQVCEKNTTNPPYTYLTYTRR